MVKDKNNMCKEKTDNYNSDESLDSIDEGLDNILAEADLEDIVDKGVRKKVSFINYLIDTVKKIGLKNIFHDKVELLIIIASAVLLYIVCFFNANGGDKYYLYKAAFMMSPLMYGCVVFFSFYNSMEKGAFELEMTCKFNLYQISALRMFFFSIICMIINTATIIILWLSGNHIAVIRTVIISAAGLFFFASVFLYLLIKLRWRISRYFIAVWIMLNVFMSCFAEDIYIDFLLKVPLYIHIIISAVCAVLYIRNLNVLINYRRRKGEI